MTTSRRRLTLIAIGIASASLLATQPALAGPVELQQRYEQQTPPTDPVTTLKEMVQRLLKFMEDMKQAQTSSTTSIKRV